MAEIGGAMSEEGEFRQAAEDVVHFLADHVPLHAWLVAVADGTGGWTPVAAADLGYGFVPGSRTTWQDAVCSRLVRGLGPHLAARVETVVDYEEAPVLRRHAVAAYVAVALLGPDGALLGAVCGLDPSPQPAGLREQLPVVQVLAELLARLHDADHARDVERDRAAHAESAALSDPLTGVLSRLGWIERLAQTTALCDRSGDLLAVLSLDVDGLTQVNDSDGQLAGDALLQQVPTVLLPVLRPSDLLARLGGDQFAVAAVVGAPSGLDRLLGRVQVALAGAGLHVSVGAALRQPLDGVETAWSTADRRMYERKVRRRA